MSSLFYTIPLNPNNLHQLWETQTKQCQLTLKA